MVDGGGTPKYSCNTATETLHWIQAIMRFLEPYRFFLDAHVVNFFKDRLWEAVYKEWMDCLRKEPVERLLQIPSGVVQDHWPSSLKEYVLTLRSLCLSRDQADLQKVFPGLRVAPLSSVLAQGMNMKKQHEIETLGAVISSIAGRVGAPTIVDVGSGQGYLAQVLCFEHELSVIAIDASSYHGSITDARAKRIEKYYAAKIRKSESKKYGFSKPITVTCQVLSPAMLKAVSSSLVEMNGLPKPSNLTANTRISREDSHGGESPYCSNADEKTPLVLAGLHACGDLSVTMLRTLIECDEVKAVISIGCCYNLLSEGHVKEVGKECGFPISTGAKSASLWLGRNARDLACQSAERWRDLGENAGLHNFQLHIYRAAFQMVLVQHYPEVLIRSPAIGRQGKALRRQHNRRILESNAYIGSTVEKDPLPNACSYPESSNASCSVDRYSMFVEFCKSGLGRLGLSDSLDIKFSKLWDEVEEFSELVGPYWSLRAALGPLLETLLLLDRLLFLQEQGNTLRNVVMLPLFDPVLSPRNMALIAEKA